MRDYYVGRGWKYRRAAKGESRYLYRAEEPAATTDIDQLLHKLQLTAEERTAIQAGKVPPAVLKRIREVGREADGIAEE